MTQQSPRAPQAPLDAPRDDDDEDGPEQKKQKASPLMRRLFEQRTILLFGPVTDELAREMVAQFLLLDADDPAAPIKVFVDSPGGSVDAGFAIYDAMRFVCAPVHTICTGLAASAATVILLGAAKGRRWSLPNTRFMLHQPSTGMQGTASDVEIGAREILRLREKVNRLYATETGHSYEKIIEDLHRDHWMSATEARDYGLIQHVVERQADLKV